MHAIADRKAFRIRNGIQIGAFGHEDPVGSRLVRFARHRQQIFQLNELRRGRPVTDRGAQRASLAVRKERDFTGNNNVLRISCDRILVDESETALPILGVKTDSDAIAIRLLWNIHFAGVRSSNCNSRRLPSIFGGYPRADMARPLAMTPMSKLARIPRGTHRKKYSHGALTFHFRHMRNLG